MSDRKTPPPEPPSDPSMHEARLEAALEAVTDGFYAVDRDWRLVLFNRAAEEHFGVLREAVIGRRLWELFPEGIGLPFERYCRAAMDEGVSTTFEAASELHPGRVVEVRVLPMRGGGVAVALDDITDRKQTEQRQRLLVHELNHRVKNALATVQAIATQSLRGEDVSLEARERFMARLMALARANDVLVAEQWEGAGLEAVARQVASPYAGAADAERFTIAGPQVHLGPNTATAFALALHELATNAAKYGALSTPEGRVELTWDIEGEDEARCFRLLWRERGGPRIATPDRVGFGTRLIDRGLSAEIRGEVRLDYAPEGLACTVTAPLGPSLSAG